MQQFSYHSRGTLREATHEWLGLLYSSSPARWGSPGFNERCGFSFFLFFFLLLPPSANLTVGTKGPGSHRSHSKCQFKWNHLASPAPETYHRLHGSLGTHRAEAYRELRLSLGALPEYLTEMPARVREIFGRKMWEKMPERMADRTSA